ncbi:hypothetical protein DPMN_063692 [Dreissena polymorpha]|uniref:Uncharacterized protein n=1 Tax=Dreissena polymorpha TaxID=45954 RepID=A0A9D4CB04_DREPO|nr:hypothetical protein DPMN_063692 [Dreissena polymorpha]
MLCRPRQPSFCPAFEKPIKSAVVSYKLNISNYINVSADILKIPVNGAPDIDQCVSVIFISVVLWQ